jgi:hypothetical protein
MGRKDTAALPMILRRKERLQAKWNHTHERAGQLIDLLTHCEQYL